MKKTKVTGKDVNVRVFETDEHHITISQTAEFGYGVKFTNKATGEYSELTLSQGDAGPQIGLQATDGTKLASVLVTKDGIELDGPVRLINTPTSAPSQPGRIWSDGGSLKLS